MDKDTMKQQKNVRVLWIYLTRDAESISEVFWMLICWPGGSLENLADFLLDTVTNPSLSWGTNWKVFIWYVQRTNQMKILPNYCLPQVELDILLQRMISLSVSQTQWRHLDNQWWTTYYDLLHHCNVAYLHRCTVRI